MKEVSKEELALISMNVILHAGNDRNYIFEAVNHASVGEFTEAKNLIQQANAEITVAHQAQTETLQKEAKSINIPYSPLFGHAQDTLMTVKAEMNMMQEIIKLYQTLKGENNDG